MSIHKLSPEVSTKFTDTREHLTYMYMLQLFLSDSMVFQGSDCRGVQHRCERKGRICSRPVCGRVADQTFLQSQTKSFPLNHMISPVPCHHHSIRSLLPLSHLSLPFRTPALLTTTCHVTTLSLASPLAFSSWPSVCPLHFDGPHHPTRSVVPLPHHRLVMSLPAWHHSTCFPLVTPQRALGIPLATASSM
jgi:hypothetical protein